MRTPTDWRKHLLPDELAYIDYCDRLKTEWMKLAREREKIVNRAIQRSRRAQETKVRRANKKKAVAAKAARRTMRRE
jgi:tRNA splicing ligase